MLEKSIDDHWNVDGDRELSDTWTGFTMFTKLSEQPPEVISTALRFFGNFVKSKLMQARIFNLFFWKFHRVKVISGGMLCMCGDRTFVHFH